MLQSVCLVACSGFLRAKLPRSARLCSSSHGSIKVTKKVCNKEVFWNFEASKQTDKRREREGERGGKTNTQNGNKRDFGLLRISAMSIRAQYKYKTLLIERNAHLVILSLHTAVFCYLSRVVVLAE